jgi:hypothetical protein
MSIVERLESRRMLSASPAYIVGQYTGVASVSFTPAAAHAPATDSITLTLSGETATGILTGPIGDSFGQPAAIAGRITSRGVAKLHIVTDRRGSDETGSLSLTFASAHAMLVGSYREADLADHPHLRWYGRLSAQAPPYDFVGTYSGTADGKYSPQNLGPQFTQTPYTADSAITVAIESADGAVMGSIAGFGVSGQAFTYQMIGDVAGNVLTLSAVTPPYQITVGATLTARAGLNGTFDILPDDLQSYFGTFSFRVAG